jgi:hypothetical protein
MSFENRGEVESTTYRAERFRVEVMDYSPRKKEALIHARSTDGLNTLGFDILHQQTYGLLQVS